MPSVSLTQGTYFDAFVQAKNHGNEPTKGAKIDAELQAEEEEMLKKKGGFGPKGS